jgi:hypothetical protein
VSESGSFSLFDDAFRRRRLDSKERVPTFPRSLQQPENICVCPAGIQPGEKDGPTSESFQVIFNARVEEEKEDGALEGIELSVDNLIEGQEVNCSADVQVFKTNVIMDVSLSLEELDEQQKAAIESVSFSGVQFPFYCTLKTQGLAPLLHINRRSKTATTDCLLACVTIFFEV